MICECVVDYFDHNQKFHGNYIERYFIKGNIYEYQIMGLKDFRVRIDKNWYGFSDTRFPVIFKDVSELRNEKLEKILS